MSAARSRPPQRRPARPSAATARSGRKTEEKAAAPPRATAAPGGRRLNERIAAVRLLLLDVDGVLTDGGIYYGEGGLEMKRFHIQDGMGVDLLMRAGLKVGILTGRTSGLVERRAHELGMQVIKQGYYDKNVGLDLVLAELGIGAHEVGYVGDDVQDLPVMRRVGFRAAPASAVAEVKAEADYVCARAGGEGAVREVADLILSTLGVKQKVVAEVTRPGVKPPAGRKAQAG